MRVQYRAGAVSGLDLTQAEQAIQSQQATLSQIEQQRVETRTGLAVLLHMPVQQLAIQEPSRLPNIQLPSIQADLPASLLSRRPDLRATELRLRKALANKDANKASYYPSISLTGNLTTGIGSSTSLSNALKNPVATLGAGLTLPFLQWNDMKRDLQVNELEYEKPLSSIARPCMKPLPMWKMPCRIGLSSLSRWLCSNAMLSWPKELNA